MQQTASRRGRSRLGKHKARHATVYAGGEGKRRVNEASSGHGHIEPTNKARRRHLLSLPLIGARSLVSAPGSRRNRVVGSLSVSLNVLLRRVSGICMDYVANWW